MACRRAAERDGRPEVWAYSSRTATSSSGRLTLSFILRCYPGITSDRKAIGCMTSASVTHARRLRVPTGHPPESAADSDVPRDVGGVGHHKEWRQQRNLPEEGEHAGHDRDPSDGPPS